MFLREKYNLVIFLTTEQYIMLILEAVMILETTRLRDFLQMNLISKNFKFSMLNDAENFTNANYLT